MIFNVESQPRSWTAQSGTSRIARLGWLPATRVLEGSPVHVSEESVAYDAMIRRYAWLLNAPFVDMLCRLPLEQARVLDVGCGPGWIPVELALRRPGWEVWALDASEDMLDQGRRHAEKAGVSDRVHFVPGSATRLPFADGEFDLAVSHFVLHHIEHPAGFFNEMARVTRGGGRVVIKDLKRQPRWKAQALLAFSRHVLGYSVEQLRMYAESLSAALTMKEVRAALARSRLSLAEVRGFRGLDFVITG